MVSGTVDRQENRKENNGREIRTIFISSNKFLRRVRKTREKKIEIKGTKENEKAMKSRRRNKWGGGGERGKGERMKAKEQRKKGKR